MIKEILNKYIFLLFIIFLGIFLSSIKKYGSDIDTAAILKTYYNLIINNTYLPSRNYGHPIAEIFFGYLSYNISTKIVIFISYLLFVFSIFFLIKSFNIKKSLYFIFLCISNPILLFDNTNISDFSLSLFLFSFLIFLYKKNKRFLSIIFFSLCIGSRLNFCINILVFFFAEYIFSKKRTTHLIFLIYLTILSILIYLIFHSFGMNIKNFTLLPLKNISYFSLFETIPRVFYKTFISIGYFSSIIIFYFLFKNIFLKNLKDKNLLFFISLALANIIVFILVPTKTAILSLTIICIYMIIINLDLNKKIYNLIIFLNILSWLIVIEPIKIIYVNDNCLIKATDAKLNIQIKNGVFFQELKKINSNQYCQSIQMGPNKNNYFEGKKLLINLHNF